MANQDNELALYRSLGLAGTIDDMRRAYYGSNATGWVLDEDGNPVGLVGPDGTLDSAREGHAAEHAAMGVVTTRSPGTLKEVVVDRFTSTSPWTSASAGVPVLAISDDGTYRSKLQLTTDGTTNNHDIVRNCGFSLANGECLNFAFDFDDTVSLLNIAVSLGGTGFSKYATLYDVGLSNNGGGGVRDFWPSGWRRIQVSKANVAAYVGGAVAADLADVRAIRLRVKTAAAAVKTVRFADMKMTRDSGGPRIIWHFDDGRDNQYSTAFPMLRAAGYVGTLAVMPASIGGIYAGGNNTPIVTQAQLNEMYAAGWEFVGHHENSFNGQSTAQRQAMIDTFKDWSVANGFVRGRSHWTLVGGFMDAASQSLVEGQFLSARRISGANGGFMSGGVFEPTQIHTVYLTQATSLASVKAKIDTLVGCGNGVLVVTGHNIVPTYTAEAEDWLTADFQELVSYAAANGVKSTSYTDEIGSMY